MGAAGREWRRHLCRTGSMFESDSLVRTPQRRSVLCSESSPSQPTVLLSVRTVPHSHDDAGFLLAWTCQLAAVALNEMDV